MDIRLLKKTGVPKAEIEAHQQIQSEFNSAPFSKGWRGYASFAIARGGRGSGDDDFDLVLVTHTNIVVIELKNWHGKLLESDGEKWFVDGECRDTSPVLKASHGLWVPIGFISTQPRHLDTTHKLICQAMARKRYGRRAKFSLKDERPMPTTFEEGCPFLQYSGLTHEGPEESD